MRARRRFVLSSLLFAVITLFGACGHEDLSTQKAVEERLTCQCGCGLTVHTCNHLQCSFAVPVKADIAASLAAGQTADEILARYVDQYGEKILSSPTAEGFNLVAWYGPFVAILLGCLGIFYATRRWRRLAAAGKPRENAGTSGWTQDEQARLKRELEEFDA